MKLLITFSLLFLFLSLNAQTFENYIKKGDSLYKSGDHLKSAKMYDRAFEIKHGNNSQYYNASCSWALTGDTIQSIEYLCRSAERGWKNLKHLKNDKDLTSLHSVDGWMGIISLVEANIEKYESSFNLPLKKKLDDIFVKDQTLRWLLGDAEQKLGRDSDKMKYYWKLISSQDSINEIEVIKILDENGWVGVDLVGKQGNKALWLVIQHAPLDTQEKYLPLLQESVKQGRSQGRHLALLEDRILMKNGKPQTYGSQVITNKNTGKKEVYKVRDPTNVNQRRKEVGLESIESYLESWGIEWSIEQESVRN